MIDSNFLVIEYFQHLQKIKIKLKFTKNMYKNLLAIEYFQHLEKINIKLKFTENM